ncbi:MAG: hypothetical protein ACRCUY_01345 [Thermoguttaceae bacterium]
MNRRKLIQNVLGGTVVAAAAAATGADLLAQQGRGRSTRQGGQQGKKNQGEIKKYDNSHFYNADGSFNKDAAKKAYIELFKKHNYSLASVVDDDRFWVQDFGLGDFANVGMGGIFWLNDKEHGYFGHEIYLLPFQMIPEHAHEPGEGKQAKHEYWQVRHGSIFNFGEGGSKDDKLPVELPKSQLDDNAITAFQCKELKAGCGENSEAALNRLGAYHFMMGGPEGAIVTEYASYHSGEGLRLQNKKGKL